MKLIHIINGTYGYRPQPNVVERKNPADGPFSVEDEEAERLISLGVAEYAEKTADAPQEEVAREAEGPDNEALTEENLSEMTNNQLKDIAESMGIIPGRKWKKADYVSAILETDGEGEEDGEDLPVLTAANPE